MSCVQYRNALSQDGKAMVRKTHRNLWYYES